jgi:hypothetical protein
MVTKGCMMRVTRDLLIVAVFVGLAAAYPSSLSRSGGGGLCGSYGGSQMSAEADTPDGLTAGGNLGSTPADAARSDAASCSLVGTWTGTAKGGAFAGSTVTMVFKGDGSYTGRIGAYSWGGNWTLSAGAFTLNDTSGSYACPSAQVGGYNVTFAPNCNTADFAATSDQCAGRAGVLDKIHLTRK